MKCPVKVAAVSAALAALLFPSLLSAAPLSQGSFGVAGSLTLAAGRTLSDADALFIGNGGNVLVTGPGTFDLAGVGGYGSVARLSSLPSLSSFTSIDSFLTAGNGTTVTLRSLDIALQSANFLNFTGEVDIFAPGFDPTRGFLSGTAVSVDGRALSLALSVSARPTLPSPVASATVEDPDDQAPPTETREEQPSPAVVATPVPEPWSAAGLALGLTAVAAVRRRISAG